MMKPQFISYSETKDMMKPQFISYSETKDMMKPQFISFPGMKDTINPYFSGYSETRNDDEFYGLYTLGFHEMMNPDQLT